MQSLRILIFLSALFSLFSAAINAQYVPLQPSVLAPDGSEYTTWRNETEYSRTYYVDRHHPEASDANTGFWEAPFLTINRAAQVVRPGERVVIKSGVYRERVEPLRGGTSHRQMISYEAAPGARVVIKGSREVPSKWVASRNPGQFSEKLWMTALPSALFHETNPFRLENASVEEIEVMPWAAEWSGRVPYTLKRGLVFQEGRRMAQIATYEDLPRVAGSYWVAEDGLTLHIHPFRDADPNEVMMEVTVQEHLFVPKSADLGFIQIKALRFLHAGNGFPRTGVGAIFTRGGHHWIIEDNFVGQVGSVGIEIGTRTVESVDREANARDRERARKSPGRVIVRHNTLTECGTGGIQGLEVRQALVENNVVLHSGWQDVERYWETAGIKLLINEKTLVRRNIIAHFRAGSGIWLDWDNRLSRVTQNLLYDLDMCCNGALFVEASRVPNVIDYNILWDIRGNGIYTGDTDNLLIAHNLIGPCTGFGVLSRVGTDRSLNGIPLTSKNNRVEKNIFYTSRPIHFEDPDNSSDWNLFVDPRGEFDLRKWQEEGWDRDSSVVDLELEFESETRMLRWTADEALPFVPTAPGMRRDYFDRQRHGARVSPGPFDGPRVGSVLLNVVPAGKWWQAEP